MIGRLHAENEHVKVSPSRYVSFVMKRYFDHYFENDLKFIARHFFDSKDYLASELRKAKSSDELRAALEKFMNDTKPIEDKPKRGRTKKVDADQV